VSGTLATVSERPLAVGLVTVALVLVPVESHLLNYPSSRFFTISGSLPSLYQHEYPHHYLLISSTRRSSMFPLILILCPALAAAFTPRQDLPEGATTLAVFQETTSSETYVYPEGTLMIGQ
jgi:hypothetical protein